MTLPRLQSKSSRSSKSKRPKPGSIRKARRVRAVALAKVKDDLSKYLRLAADEEIVITRHGRPAGVIIGFESDDDWFAIGSNITQSSCGESRPPEWLLNRVAEFAWKNLGMSV